MNIKSKATRCFPGKGSPFLGGQENSNDFITITLVANAGVLIEHKGVGILVDGIHNEGGHPFSRVSENDMKFMQQGVDIFSNLDYLLFTHEHPDHLSPQHVSEVIQKRTIKGLFLPGEHNSSPDLALLLNQVQQRTIPYWNLGLDPGETQRIELSGDLIVTVIGTRHLGPQFRTVRNDCFLLTLAGMNLLFTGDADHNSDYFINSLKEVSLDAVFVNPIFYHNPNGQKIINEIFCPRNVVIYHMPFSQDDTMHFSYMVQSDIQRHAHSEIQTHILSRNRQSLCFFLPSL